MKRKPPKPRKRIIPGEVRGVPLREYRAFARAVRLGKTTWEELEALGKVQPITRLTEAFRFVEGLTKGR